MSMKTKKDQQKEAADSFRVTLIKDTALDYPDLYLDVWIEGDKYEQIAFSDMFVRARCHRAKSIEEADLVVFTGGDDVDPVLYGEAAHESTVFNPDRDSRDIEVYQKCYDAGIPMFGVCRGAQFGHVMNGGKLYQHVDNHNGPHQMYLVRDKKYLNNVSSVHHQMCIRNEEGGMEVLGESPRASERWVSATEKIEGHLQDVEAFWYRDTCFFGVQGHPEYKGYNIFTQWCLQEIENLIINNPDLIRVDGKLRLKPDILEQRKQIKQKKAKELS